MKNLFISAVVLLFWIWGCNDVGSGSLFKPSNIKGTVFLEDTFVGSPATIAPEGTVYLATNAKAEPYIFQVKTDSKGKFSFGYEPTDETLCLVGKYTDTSGIEYTKTVTLVDFNQAQNQLTLSPVYPKGKLKVTVKDATSIVNKAEVYLFVNKANADSFTDKDLGSAIDSKITNNNGIAFFYGLAPTTYYIKGKKGSQIFDIKTIALAANELKEEDLLPPTPTQTQFKVTVTSDSQPILGAEVYLFSSQSQANSIKLDPEPENYVTKQNTNLQGEASFQGLKNGEYYAAARIWLVINGVRTLKLGFSQKITISMSATTTPQTISL
jgi:uncharacterized lipoprotein NlpE involved in copper resistance